MKSKSAFFLVAVSMLAVSTLSFTSAMASISGAPKNQPLQLNAQPEPPGITDNQIKQSNISGPIVRPPDPTPPSDKLHKNKGQSLNKGIIVQGRGLGAKAIGPKPEDPAHGGLGVKNEIRAIGPKQDDPSAPGASGLIVQGGLRAPSGK